MFEQAFRNIDDDLSEFVMLQKTFADSPKSWSVDAKNIAPFIDMTTYSYK